ncbi:CPBP family intramembrane metalloprotease [Leisingera aquaemixtae]|uniref:CPBP family intramembrane glutamic endopeptidase n=1 Tax=Leisingera aquaemixtae TaxID=1396826 RepID=UPI001C96DB4A|nr:CPBP family intramembrane glutamic endopeptidase [Leisingera aquaemixtae]MBY6067717.1 CPBP family intramembrane metalloprotease [Leisingera aquaemixtae]
MSFVLTSLPQTWPWLILMAALTAGWAGRRGLAFALLAVFAGAAVALGHLTPLALMALATGLLFAAFLPRTRGPAGLIGHAVLVLWSLALGAHLLPGVQNLSVLDQVRATPASAPYSLHLNLDKPLVFFALLLAWPALLQRNDPTGRPVLAAGLLLLAALLPLALLTGALRLDPGLPEWTLLWMASNLLLTCLAEEAFFRGYLQQGLCRRFGPAAGIAAASLLFGLAHLGAGPAVAAFATLLGLACGLGYWGAGRFWVPVMMHFAFNLTHLLLFTYPGPA